MIHRNLINAESAVVGGEIYEQGKETIIDFKSNTICIHTDLFSELNQIVQQQQQMNKQQQSMNKY